MAKNKADLNHALQGVGEQFNNLDFRDPGSWPAIPRYVACLGVLVLMVGVMWVVVVADTIGDLISSQEQEEVLKTEYKNKLEQAVNLELLTRQKEEVQQYVSLLEKQLPSEAEMDALLSDIAQAGFSRGLQIDVSRPSQVVVKDYYEELPISIKGQGSFDNIAGFAADVAKLSRIVTLGNISMRAASESEKSKASSSDLVLEATAKTFRYLGEAEIEAQRKAQKERG